MHLILLKDTLAVCRLAPGTALPDWARGSLVSVTHTADESSVLCALESVPDTVKTEKPWRAFRVAGTLDFNEIGILSALAKPLADAAISIFVVSTFDTDYLLVKAGRLKDAVSVLEQNGHKVSRAST